MRSGPFLLLYAPILFCLFYSRIQAASQSKKGQCFPYFGEFFPNLRILFGFNPKFKRHRLQSSRKRRITRIGTHVFPMGRMIFARQEFRVRMFF